MDTFLPLDQVGQRYSILLRGSVEHLASLAQDCAFNFTSKPSSS